MKRNRWKSRGPWVASKKSKTPRTSSNTPMMLASETTLSSRGTPKKINHGRENKNKFRLNRIQERRREIIMPGKKHLRGVGKKEQRQYEHIKEAAQKEGRYGDRAKEVAARTVMKHHRQSGHKKGT